MVIDPRDNVFEYHTLKEMVALIATGKADIVCESCGYNLRGIEGASKLCPECGTENLFSDEISDQDVFLAREGIDGRSALASTFSVSVCIGFLMLLKPTELCCIWAGIIVISVIISAIFHSKITQLFGGVPERHYILPLLPGGKATTVSMCLSIFLVSYLILTEGFGFLDGTYYVIISGTALTLVSLGVYFRFIRCREKMPADRFKEVLNEAAIRSIVTKRIKGYRNRMRE